MKNRGVALRGIISIVAVLVLAFAMLGCAQSNKPSATDNQTTNTTTPAPDLVELQIFAANSLEKALPEVQALYTGKHPEVTFAASQFKASGDLVEQIKAGGTGDLLITASKGSMDSAGTNGSIDEGTRVDMFINDLVVVKAKGSNITLNSLEDIRNDAFARIAIGDAASVPAGQYANQALNKIGLYSSDTGKDGQYDAAISSKIVPASSVGNAANYVATGDCQVGFVYTSDLYRYEGLETAFTVPSDVHTKILYPGDVLKSSKNAAVAADFMDFCLSDPDALRVWSEYGFELI